MWQDDLNYQSVYLSSQHIQSIQFMFQSPPFDSTMNYLADKAANNYAAHADEIIKIVQRISENRNGFIPLTDVTDDKTRLLRRAAREGVPIEWALERINEVPNFMDMASMHKIVRASASVCRIVLQGPSGISGYGTGFLVAPNVLITNNHVFPDAVTASRAIAQFNYELGGNGQVLTPVSFRLRPDLFFLTSPYKQQVDVPFSGRDFTLVAVEPTNAEGADLSQFGFVRLDPSLGKIIEGENCVMIQHPKGDYKKVVLNDIRLITLTNNFLIYEAYTLPGSSGSLVLGLGTAEVVALHHSAVPRKDDAGNWLRKDGKPRQAGDTDDDIDWIGNEGVRVSCIVEAFNNLPIPDAMQPVRAKIVEAQTPPLVLNNASPVSVAMVPIPHAADTRTDIKAVSPVPTQSEAVGDQLESVIKNRPINVGQTNIVNIFISYAHKDVAHKEKLMMSLHPLIRQNKIQVWQDSEIVAGQRWNDEIMEHLEQAHIVMTLMSPDFIHSDFCYSIELDNALKAHARGKKTIIPVQIRPCSWKDKKLNLPIGNIQGIPAKPISDYPNRDKAWMEVFEEVQRVLDHWQSQF